VVSVSTCRINTLTFRSSLLLANENIIYTSTILVRPPTTISLPNFLMPAPKRRQLILTDFPRLFTVKEEISPASLSVKSECVFVAHSQRKAMGRGEVNARVEQGAAGWVLDVQDKGVKGFTVQTVSALLHAPQIGADGRRHNHYLSRLIRLS
jgi:3-phosphoinositide dependent protein kinase-1